MIHVEHQSGTIRSLAVGQHQVDTLLFHLEGDEGHRANKPVIVRLHGILGNLLDETEHFLPAELARCGYSSINMNTLLANLGLFYGFGLVERVIPQIDAVCDFVRGLGFKKIVVAGHGLGGCMAILYAALRNDRIKWPDLCGVIAIATPYSLPETIRCRWEQFGSEPSYDEVCRRAAKRFGGPDEGIDETILIHRAHGPTRRPQHSEVYTLKTWWHLAGPEAHGTQSHLHISEVKVPMLLIDGLQDEVLMRRNDEDLARVARSAGHDTVTWVQLDANHAFDGKHAELAQVIADWLAGLLPTPYTSSVPANVASRMKSSALHEKQDLMRFRAEDGFLVTALMVTPDFREMEEIRDIPILLQIHGSLGHFLARGTPRLLPQALSELGYSSFSINTRLANAGQMTGQGIFPDTIKDIDAALAVLMQQGFRNIFMLGYSLGASMVTHWARNRDHSSVRGFILEGCLYSSAASQRKRFEQWGATPGYEEVYARAKKILGHNPYNSENDETFLVYQSKGPSHQPINDEIFTYKTWWFMAGPEAHAAMAHEHIGKVTAPVLMMRGERDHMVEAWELGALADLLRASGNRQVRAIEVPNAGHDCLENRAVMLREIVQMLSTHRT